MSEIKLLPCPFCGGEAYFPTITKTFIECKSCGFETEYTEDTEWLVNTWNTRKPIENIVEQLEEWTFNADVNLGDGTLKNSDLIASKNAIEIVKAGGVNDD